MIFDYAGVLFVMLGAILAGRHNINCWILYQIGNILLLIQAYNNHTYNMVVYFLFLSAINVYGYMKWRRFNE